MTGCDVYDEVYPWQRETVLWTCLVDVSEVDTESPLAICFFDEYDVGQPLMILYLPDRPCMEKLVDLLVYGFLSFWSEASPLLLDRLEGWANVSLWVIAAGSIPPMSACFHVKTSLFCLKN